MFLLLNYTLFVAFCFILICLIGSLSVFGFLFLCFVCLYCYFCDRSWLEGLGLDPGGTGFERLNESSSLASGGKD